MTNKLLEIYGPTSSSDNMFAARARFHQSWYRNNILGESEYGFGPDKESNTRYGNILIDGQNTGKNFLSHEIFNYVKFRTQFLKKGETIKEYRLFNNMLSSQPMCFNLFYPLKRLFECDDKRAGKLLDSCFPQLNINKIITIEIEFLPYPVSDYLNDRTAFDAMLIYSSVKGERNVLAIETKYVEKLGANTSSDLKEQIKLVSESNFFNQRGKELSLLGFDQLGRNFLLAEKFRKENRLDRAFAIVISPSENSSSIKEIEDFHLLMNSEYHRQLFFSPLENIVEAIRANTTRDMLSWIDNFKRRYLGFAECERIYNEYCKI